MAENRSVARGLTERLARGAVGDVGLQDESVATGVPKLPGNGLALWLAPCADRYIGALPSESEVRSLADARAASGDYGYFAV